MKKVSHYKFFYYIYIYIYIYKMGKTTYYQRYRETILNTAKDYYENNKEVLREKVKRKV